MTPGAGRDDKPVDLPIRKARLADGVQCFDWKPRRHHRCEISVRRDLTAKNAVAPKLAMDRFDNGLRPSHDILPSGNLPINKRRIAATQGAATPAAVPAGG